MQSNFIDSPEKCAVCGNLKTLPYTWNSTILPVMCTCTKAPSLAWECFRCNKINAPWKGSCDCTPSPLSGAPTSISQPYTAGPNVFNHYFPDPKVPTTINCDSLNKNFTDK